MDKSNFTLKGEEYIKQAEKKLKGGFFSNMITSKSERLDEAKELFGQAANCFKLSNDFEKAVHCYERCIECEENDYDKGQYYLEIAHQYKKQEKISEYLSYSRKAIDQFCFGKRIGQAASLAKECAELLEEQYDYEEAIKFYEKTSELYQLEEQTTHSNTALVKSCDLRILTRDYSKMAQVIKSYEKVGKKFLQTPLIKTQAKDLFFKVCLCYLANEDLVGAKRAIQNYDMEDPNFENSRERELLTSIIDSIENNNQLGFIQKVSEYNKFTPFDRVKSTFIAKIKEIYLPEEENRIKNQGIDLTGAIDNQDKKQGGLDFT